MASPEMISGPDLGGGFLHQFTREVSGSEARFVFHAQEGGQDAGGPPKGNPEPLGWRHPPSACQFGGPRCWHREFVLSATQESPVRACYNRTRFVFEAQIAQLYGGADVPVAPTVEELDSRIAPAMEQAGIAWHWGGAVAAWLQGIPIAPRSIELLTGTGGVEVIRDAIAEYLIEPLGMTDWPPGRLVCGARAFVGTLARGMRVEWGIELEPAREGAYDLEWGIPASGVPVQELEWNGRRLRVSRLEFALGRALVERRSELAMAIAARVRSQGPDVALLRQVLRAAKLDERETGEVIIAVERPG